MASNPTSVQMTQPGGGTITCMSFALYWQRVTLSWRILNTTTTLVFQGSGEGVPMKLADGSTIYPVDSARQNYGISILFEFSTTGPSGPFSKATVKDPIINQQGENIEITITSEDSADNDNNDSYLIINYQSLG